MKNFIIFLSGAAAGTGISYYFLKRFYNRQLEVAVEEIRNDYNERMAALQNQADESDKKMETQEPDNATIDETEYQKPEKNKSGKHTINTTKVNYAAASVKTDESEIPEESSFIKTKTAPKGRKRYCIAPEEFIELNGYEKVTLTYFEEDETFMNENEEVEFNGMKLIGKSNLAKIGDYPDGTLYVRNEDEGTDYEIIFEDGSYGDFVDRG